MLREGCCRKASLRGCGRLLSRKFTLVDKKRPICESGKGDEGGWLCEAPHLPRSVFSKSSFPKLASRISPIFVHGELILKKKAFLTPRLKRFRRGSGKGSGDGPRYAVDWDATFRRWPSMPGKSGRDPSRGSFGSREASWWSTGRVVRRFFARFPPSRRLGASFQSKVPGQLKASWIILRNGSAQLVQLTTKWQGLGV